LFQATKIDKEGFTSSPQHELEKKFSWMKHQEETGVSNGNLTLSFTII
jgi:hypothetical protein